MRVYIRPTQRADHGHALKQPLGQHVGSPRVSIFKRFYRAVKRWLFYRPPINYEI